MAEIKWAVLGTGVIANEMAAALAKDGRNIYAVGNRTHSKAVAFAEKYGIEKVYDDFEEMFTDPDVDVIYITTPHNTHLPFMEKALRGGKHVLAEKSITLNSAELERVRALAKEKKLILAEAMTIYHMPLYRKLREILAFGRLGKVNLITMNFGSFKEYDMQNRFFNRNLAGGAMLDIGVYALSFVRWFMESKPDVVLSQYNPAPTGVDESSVFVLKNAEAQMATVALSLHSKQPKRGMISCEKGYIEIMEYPRAEEAVITYVDGTKETVRAGAHEDALMYELQDMEMAIQGDTSHIYAEYTEEVMEIRKRRHDFMEERLKVEVQISSYDAKGLQCFVAEQIQKYRPEESGPKKMFKKVAGSLVKRIPCQAELQLALNVLSVPAVNRNHWLAGVAGTDGKEDESVLTIDRFSCQLHGEKMDLQADVSGFNLERLLDCLFPQGDSVGIRVLQGIRNNISEQESYQLLEYIVWWANEHRVYQLALDALQQEEAPQYKALRQIQPHIEYVHVIRDNT